MGDKITQEMAEELLENQVVNLFAPGLFSLLPMMKKWKPNQQAALISWAFNIGLGAAEESTLCKRILASEDPTKVVIEELPRWNKADGKVLEGLVRRRRAEVDLFTGSTQAAIKDETTVSPVKVTPSSPFATRLTAHVQLGEFALWQEERRFAHQYQVDTAAELAAFLERVRVAFGNKAIIITSGYRSPAINKSVGGASSSEHLFDAPGVGAVDFYVKDADIKAVENWCDKNWPFSVGYGAAKGFVHIGIREGRPRIRWDYN
jgi:GH24 family phage-related lysozyme (muramidase)